MKYIAVLNKKTKQVILFEWPWDFFDRNPYTELKRGYKILEVHRLNHLFSPLKHLQQAIKDETPAGKNRS